MIDLSCGDLNLSISGASDFSTGLTAGFQPPRVKGPLGIRVPRLSGAVLFPICLVMCFFYTSNTLSVAVREIWSDTE